MEYKYSDVTGRIIKACMNVHSALGNGFPELLYQRALAIELVCMGIMFKQEACVKVYYREKLIGERRVDFLVDDKITVELKAVSQLDNNHLNQGINYLEAYNYEVGLLVNFGASQLEWKRLFNKKYKP
ncbi:MAG TPA: GxxExxY protein [Chitinophagaceae bacterium]|nr:GxxExxY protein [Chitinophagaceae bacterium]